MRISPRFPLQALLLTAGFVMLVLVSGVSVWLVTQSRTASDAVTHTLEVNYAVSGLRVAIRRAESAQRGYLLTGEDGYRRMFADARASIARQLDRLETQTRDNPDQTSRIRAIRDALSPMLASLDQSIALRTDGQVEAAIAFARAGPGLDLMNEVSDEITAMADAERTLLAERRIEDARLSDGLLIATLFGASVIIVLAIASVLLVRRSTAGLIEAQAELEHANTGLEEKVDARTADLQEANAELQRFVYIVGHDLRSPLVNIMGFTSELETLRDMIFARLAAAPESGSPRSAEEDATLRSDLDEALGFIKSSIAKMDRLINAILALSRAGRREFSPEPVDLADLIATLTGALTHQIQEADASLSVGQLPTIQSDRLALEQIFSNLLDNAVKYLRPGVPGRITVSATERKGFAIVRIADNGRGVAEKDLDRIFELFRRAGPQDRPGEGIGLAHVRTLVRRLGGSIRVESTPGEGTTFSLILPRVWNPAPSARAGAADDGPERKRTVDV